MFHVKQKEYVEYLFKYNANVNLVSRRMKLDNLGLLIEESLLIEKYLDDFEYITDSGSGNGLLGIPLSLKYPEKRFNLVEPLKKKTDFLYSCKEKFNYSNINIYTCKIESFLKDNKTDLIIARGFPYNEVFVEHLLKNIIKRVVLITSINKFEKIKNLYDGKVVLEIEKISWRDNLIILKMEKVSRGTK